MILANKMENVENMNKLRSGVHEPGKRLRKRIEKLYNIENGSVKPSRTPYHVSTQNFNSCLHV